MRSLPLWVAVPITVTVSMPFGLWLGPWNLPLWVAFIVWTEYFTLGARPDALKVMVPGFLVGSIAGTLSLIAALALDAALGGWSLVAEGDVGWIVGLAAAFGPLMYVIKYLSFTQGPGGLPYFNGITMGMATYFVGGYEEFGGLPSSALPEPLVPLVTILPAAFAGLLGAFLGWFNIALMPRVEDDSVSQAEQAVAEGDVGRG